MGLLANRMGNRMETRQMMRTASRMQRRRAALGLGTWGDQEAAPEPAPAAAPAAPDPTAQLEQLADLQRRGLITEDEYAAKKRQVLGL